MAQVPIDEGKLKELFKTALHEVLEERKDTIRDLIEEAIEDIALAHAIEEGQRTQDLKRREVVSLLEGRN